MTEANFNCFNGSAPGNVNKNLSFSLIPVFRPNLHSSQHDENDKGNANIPNCPGSFNAAQYSSAVPRVESNRHEFLPPIRKYICKSRIRKESKPSKVEKWKSSSKARSDEQWRALVCCKKLQCFKTCNVGFLKRRVQVVLQMSLSERRRSLHDMLTSEGKFVLNGEKVCSIFLHIAFHFSRDLQVSVKANGPTQLGCPVNGIEKEPSCMKKEAIVSFLRRIAESTSEKMPHKTEFHIPYFQKQDVYKQFVSEYKRVENDSPPSLSYFMTTWNNRCSQIKIRKSPRFSLCTMCEQSREAIRLAIASGRDTSRLLREYGEHKELVKREREAYVSKRDLARLNPEKFCSVIIDGADQSAYALPHFVTKTKDMRGYGLKVRLIGLLEHGAPNRLHLMTLTQEYETGSNHIIESIHRFLLSRTSRGPLPKKLFIQADNCTRENKNRFVIAYLESLVAWGVFDEIELAFLPIGHTHEDIDQCFSCTSRRLSSNDAVTISDLHNQLRTVYNSYTTVTEIRSIANFKGLCDLERCIRDPPPFSHLRYFHITRNGHGPTKTLVLVKEHVFEDWTEMKTRSGGSFECFLTKTPELCKTPPTIVTCPDGFEEFCSRLASEEWRINSSLKLQELRNIRDRVFRTREEPFSWDLNRAPEKPMRQLDQGLQSDSVTFEMGQEELQVEDEAINDFFYDRNSFVLVKNGNADSFCPFWLARIRKIINNSSGVVIQLDVQWYELSSRGTVDCFSSAYQPAYFKSGTKSKVTKTAWTDIISVNSVLLHFEKLTKHNRLPAAVRKKISSHCAPAVAHNGAK